MQLKKIKFGVKIKKAWTICLNILLSLLWIRFAYGNIEAYINTNNTIYILFTLSESQFAFLLLIRYDAHLISRNVVDYISALIGTFAVLFYTPSTNFQTITHLWIILGDILIYTAVVMQILGFASLHKSSGIIPANRGIQTTGMYSYIRHPIYIGSILLYCGYVILNPTWYNNIILFIAFIFQIIRIYREEALLKQDPLYIAYAQKVRWRLVPFIF